MSGFGSLKDADRKQFVSGINEEAPPGVLKQLARCNITVHWVTAGISLLKETILGLIKLPISEQKLDSFYL